jgi:hypothetical protein
VVAHFDVQIRRSPLLDQNQQLIDIHSEPPLAGAMSTTRVYGLGPLDF